ncbi:glycoside hydrolase family 2 TIM barrel-domain containing protein [Runella slithyformis]|uniref:Secreted protein n=1 Tax=Runella slithyformis (strain ATCC 29530 / DSM 19594 / LMG 11500 / NCIMB 11436 / LSU 4) TaxID=761193 RepID=A0A7U3ZLV6_RUNSL|nr:putative secreted protein [Runella slithyformis DSM 19594]
MLFLKRDFFSVLNSGLFVLLIALLSGCGEVENSNLRRKVYIEKKDGRYTLYKDGKPFFIKGASGYSYGSVLKASGGNTFRTWDTTRLAVVLDSALANDLSVIVGFYLPDYHETAFFEDPGQVAQMHKAYQNVVNRFKHHPSLLMWSVGNEVILPYNPSYNNFYTVFNSLVDMVHRDDPDHPVTTVLLNFDQKSIFNLVLRCDVDILSFNIYSRINTLRDDLAAIKWLWSGPYMLSEWGINGPWGGTEQTAWGAYLELNSSEKAALCMTRYRQYMPLEDSRFFGSCLFYWGHKQEGTHTWFSLFDEAGALSETVGTMRFLWTGKSSQNEFPVVKSLLLNSKKAKDNILLTPNTPAVAALSASGEGIKTIKWQLFKEDWLRINNRAGTQKLTPMPQLNKSSTEAEITFTVPEEEGPYRLFATIYNNRGNYATCNIPFYVVSPQ